MAFVTGLRIKKGEIITARYLGTLSENVDDLIGLAVAPPRQLNKPAEPKQQNEEPLTEALTDMVETERTVTEEQIFDQDEENYALIDRFDRVAFQNGLGETLVLLFRN